ncbi:MAG: xanthine dehydrogenase family protein molybdopterin-binding subunit [bacterium]|nr:xanthine dehydrogenase family protein molybdopterin-binding subunit [bacterium]
MAEHDLIGKSNIRFDAIPKADGSLPYGEDMVPTGALHCGVLFSPVPYGTLRKLDISKAKKVPGVAAVLTAENIPGKNIRYGSNTLTHAGQPVLIPVGSKIEFTGDALAIVGAETREALDAGIHAIRADIESHSGTWTMSESNSSAEKRRVCDFETARGNLEAGFKEADVIIEKTYTTQLAEHAFLEPCSGSSWIDEDGVLTIRVGTQLIEYYRAIAAIIGVPQSKVRHLGTFVGGGFGAKGMMTVEPYLALLTHLTKRPAAMTLGREEGIRSTVKKHPFVMHYRTGVTREGKIVALEADIVGDAGAYPYKSNLFLLGAMCIAGGPYEIENIRIRAHGYLTNNPITNAMRGVGSNQVCFAYESQIELAAKELGIDPFELRRRNFIQKGGKLPTGQAIPFKPNLEGCLESARKALGARSSAKPGKRIGQGFAANITGYGRPFDDANAAVHLEPDGSAVVRVSAPDIGAGQGATLQTIAAEVLGLRLDQVAVHLSDSATTPLSGITAGSRQTMMAGNALKGAAEEVRKALLRGASSALEAAEGDIRMSGGEIWVTSSPDRRITTAQAGAKAKELKESLHCTHGIETPGHEYENPERYMGGMGGWADYTFGVHATEVEVDIDTGEVNVLKHVACHDVGRALNPQSVEGQFEGGAVMGIGYALHEEITMTKGDCRSQSFHEYLIPTSTDIGDFESIILECGEGLGPFGARGVGEPPCNNAPAAVALAVNNAIGTTVYELPITPEKVCWAVRGKNGNGRRGR